MCNKYNYQLSSVIKLGTYPICAKCSTFSQISADQTSPIAVTAPQWMTSPFPQNPVNLYPTQDMLVPKLLLEASMEASSITRI
jgi:hypothetical protein